MSAITPWKWGWGEFGEAVVFWGFVGRGGDPFVPKAGQVDRTQKVIQADIKPKAIQSTNPFKAVKR